MAQQQVFISYAWGGESEKVADEIEAQLSSKGIRLVRDKTDLGFKGLIREFMMEIGQGNLVVLIISDKYLKSKNCMFELLEVEKKGEFYSRIFPLVLPDADIYDSLGIINYLKYWDQKIKELNASVKELDNLADTRKVQEDINLYTDIRGAVDDLAGKLSNMNTLTLEIMRSKKYQPLLDALLEKTSSATTPKPSKKEGKVLYHIPGMMQVEKWTRCTVRLAWEEILLTEGLRIPENERMIESIRLGNVMQVSLNEGRDGQNFEIKALNHEEQVIEEDEATQWLFDVKPLSVGDFILILRVTLVQIIEGKERKKDIVLERNVVTEAIVPEALARFETAEKGLYPPRVEREITSTKGLESFPKGEKNNPEDLEEFIDEIDQHPMSSGSANSSAAPSPAPPNLSRPSSTSQPSPKAEPNTFRKILPYAASLAGIVLIVYLFIPEYKTGYTSHSPNYTSTDTVSASLPYPGEKIVVSLTLDATGPDGEKIKDVQVFVIENEKLDSLDFLDLGDYILTTYPTSDTMKRSVNEIGNFTILQIQDSVAAVDKKPIRVGNKLIDRRNIKINPEN
ncbi:MAG TPA: toll/interleukin-1 receptor domain-containing protein [Algoriphagus sp.]|nr:toll/interleukin-1 receptor domain-containing protein [Algoriphagus sp.]